MPKTLMKLHFCMIRLENKGVKRFLGILLSCACLLGLTNVNPAFAFGGVTKVQVTHSHDGGDHHHHHHDGAEETSQNPDSSDPNSSGVPHTHEIFLSSSVFYFSTQATSMIGLEPPSDIFPEPHEISPPTGPNLGSIFRPPIA